jgi:membrane protein DedA with SNARE-associated domain
MPRNDLAPANAVTITIAVLVAAATVANALSAVLTGTVWVVSARTPQIRSVTEASDAFSYWVILIAPALLVAYFAWDIWRRPRRRG